MAKFDFGGGCPCGLYRECLPGCEYSRLTNQPTKQEETNMPEQENDFGFTFADEKNFTKVEKVLDVEKMKKLRSMIIPLLLNLKKNPEKDIIQWPGKERIKSIDAFIKKMDKLIDE